jgi:hypothetical protein
MKVMPGLLLLVGALAFLLVVVHACVSIGSVVDELLVAPREPRETA